MPRTTNASAAIAAIAPRTLPSIPPPEAAGFVGFGGVGGGAGAASGAFLLAAFAAFLVSAFESFLARGAGRGVGHGVVERACGAASDEWRAVRRAMSGVASRGGTFEKHMPRVAVGNSKKNLWTNAWLSLARARDSTRGHFARARGRLNRARASWRKPSRLATRFRGFARARAMSRVGATASATRSVFFVLVLVLSCSVTRADAASGGGRPGSRRSSGSWARWPRSCFRVRPLERSPPRVDLQIRDASLREIYTASG